MLLRRVVGLLVLLFNLVLPAHGQPATVDKMRLGSTDPGKCGDHDLDDSQWREISLYHLPQGQRFCLRKAIHIEEDQFTDVGVVIFSILGSSRLYWDGRLIGENGTVGTNRHSEVPGGIYFIAPIPAESLSAGPHQLAIEVSNFHISETMASAFYFLAIGDYGAALTTPLKQSGAAVFFMGGLVVIALFFQLFFWLYQRRLLYQLFSLMCLSSASLLLAEKWRPLFGYSYDLHTVRMHWIILFTYISCLMLPVFYLVYYKRRKTLYFSLLFAVVLVLPLSMPGYDGKSATLFLCSLVITLILNIEQLIRRIPDALPNTILIAFVLALLVFYPYEFLEDRFALTSFAIVLVVMSSIIREMKSNRLRALAAVRYEVDLLKRNLHPHFLMNSLMLVIEWIEQKPRQAAGFVQALAEELRMLVRFSGQRLITLDEEVSLCRRHVEIMGYRYEASYTFSIEGLTKDISVPPAVLHTQIENAFTHNRVPEGSVFTLTIKREKGTITLVLTSPLLQKNKTEGLGLGERYIQTRLAETFGGNCIYEGKAENGFWTSTITFAETG